MPRVLIVEDSPTQAREMQWILEEAGFEVEAAGDGLEALRAIRTTLPDIVVTDLVMPGMDGVALVEALRHDVPFIPVVLVTGFGSEKVAARALRAGAASYVPKSDLDLDLVPTVKEILEVVVAGAEQRELLRRLEQFSTRFVLENDPALVAPLVRYLEEVLAAMRFCDATELIRIGVALRETLVAAIEHGNLEVESGRHCGGGPEHRELVDRRRREPPYSERRVHVSADVSASQATFLFRVEGPGFGPSAVPGATDLARSGGRGSLLTRTFMDEVVVKDRSTAILLVKRAAAPA